MTVRAPFPWFGGKSSVAAEIWRRFGDVDNYVEPFFGSGAVLLARPHVRGVETVNDADGYVANFWRAVQAAPDEVAAWCDWPINEADLHARHYWLITEGRERLARLLGDPDGFDAQVAGWWCWGLCAWIGGDWCSGRGAWRWDGERWVGGSGAGVSRRRPHLSTGMGIHRSGERDVAGWIRQLAARLRRVRICYGDWSRVCGDSVTIGIGRTAVFLDPPYSHAERDARLYVTEMATADAVREWAIEAGKRPDMLVCLAGYDGEHELPGDWSTFAWKAGGGLAKLGEGRGRANAARERLWFSPACEARADLFSALAETAP